MIDNTDTDTEGFRLLTSSKADGKHIVGSSTASMIDNGNGFEVLNDDSIRPFLVSDDIVLGAHLIPPNE